MRKDATEALDPALADLVPDFLANRRADHGRLQQLLEEADYVTIRKLAHRLKGVGGGYWFDSIDSRERFTARAPAGLVLSRLELLDDLQRIVAKISNLNYSSHLPAVSCGSSNVMSRLNNIQLGRESKLCLARVT